MSERAGRIGRAFLAVVPDERALDAVARAMSSLALPGGWRATPREQWHVTLQFLGGVDDVDGVARAVSSVASRHHAFGVALGGGGAFPSARRAGAAWIGARAGEGALRALAGDVSDALAPLGYARDEERFHAHLTVARTRGRDRRDARPLVDGLSGAADGPPWTVRDVVLFESRTRPSGAEYSAVERFGLAGAEGA
ncbi:MAG TPA: RNA 2',3'-cyclic phosphodiesterase [Acidimicrobiia bacterium]|nr:RNA 2',3'-cyclic phosphodiesterase [Acidimicrobiia bacterium]